MNGIFNNNFLTGLVLAKDLPEQTEKLVVALAAGESKSLMGAVLMKPQIDKILELEAKKTTAEARLKEAENALANANAKIDFLDRAIGVKVNIPAEEGDPLSATLTIDGANPKWSLEPAGTVNITEAGILAIPKGTTGTFRILAVNDAGVTRKMQFQLEGVVVP